MEVSIIIVNYNSTEHLRNCLLSIFKYVSGIQYEIIVVDNASETNDVDELVTEFKNVKFILNKDNVGYAKANNIAVNYSKGKYLFFLNPDTLLQNNIITEFIKYLNNVNDIACLGCILIDSFNNLIHSYGSFLSVIKDIVIRINHTLKKFLFLRSKVVSKSDFDLTSLPDLIDVDYITGAALFIKKKLFIDFGLFNERYFMYFEESDLQYKFFKSNLRRVIIKNSKIVHLLGKSLKSSNHKRVLYNSSKCKFVKNNYGFTRYVLIKIVYISMGIIDLFIDILYKEYKLRENLSYLKYIIKA